MGACELVFCFASISGATVPPSAEPCHARHLAGYTGALLCNNGELVTDFAGKVARTVLHSVSKADLAAKAYPELGSSADESLRRLSAEVRAVAQLYCAFKGGARCG